jgi:molybdate transport system substrate-binding protein
VDGPFFVAWVERPPLRLLRKLRRVAQAGLHWAPCLPISKSSAAPELDGLAQVGKIAAGAQTDVTRSAVGLAVRAGAPKPDIGTVEALKRTLQRARSIGYSDGPSGAYIAELLQRLGIAQEMKSKIRLTSRPVAEIVAEGEAEVGMQQIVAILPVKGADLAGPLPSELQNVIVYAAGLAPDAAQSAAARTFIAFMAMPEVASLIRAKGMEPG